jgi:hypothetical protein
MEIMAIMWRKKKVRTQATSSFEHAVELRPPSSIGEQVSDFTPVRC